MKTVTWSKYNSSSEEEVVDLDDPKRTASVDTYRYTDT